MTVRSRLLGLVLLTGIVACSSSPQAEDGSAGPSGAPAAPPTAAPPPAGDVRTLTGAPTKVVWVHADGSDPFAAGDQLVLMGLSTEDGRGQRGILGRRQSYVKPLLTPRGDRIVFSTRPQGDGSEVFVVGWDGSGLTRVAKGFALAVWEDPMDGVAWIYVGGGNKDGGFDFATVSRFPIDAPSKTELVWNKTLVSSDTFQLSADGRLAAGLFPWPHAGVAQLPNKSWEPLGEGCWTAMTTARGPIMWYFDGAHRNLTLVDLRTRKRWIVAINQAPGFQNPEVYHPRWTNHPRFLVMSGPYDQGGENQVRTGGVQSEVWLGRFSEDFTRIEAWTRVTTNSGSDAYPDVWIDRDRSSFAARPAGAMGPATSTTTSGTATRANSGATRAVVEVRLAHAGPVPTPASILPYRHALVVNAYEIVTVVDGRYPQRTIHVAQWAIRDGKVLPQAKRTPGSTTRLTVERYDAHPELEGERLLTDIGASDLPLYYEIKP